MDFRGHGESARSEGRYRVVDYVEDAARFLEEEIGRPAAVYGHSLGAMVAAATAARAPGMVMAVVLEDPPFHTMGRRIRETALHGFFSALRTLDCGVPLEALVERLG